MFSSDEQHHPLVHLHQPSVFHLPGWGLLWHLEMLLSFLTGNLSRHMLLPYMLAGTIVKGPFSLVLKACFQGC